eukprot:1123015-Prymnesium_polylepis.1
MALARLLDTVSSAPGAVRARRSAGRVPRGPRTRSDTHGGACSEQSTCVSACTARMRSTEHSCNAVTESVA